MTPDARTEACDEMRLLIQAEIDGEIDAARAASLAAHVAECEGCAATRERLVKLSAALRGALPSYAAPPALREAVLRRIAEAQPQRPARPLPRQTPLPQTPLQSIVRRWREALAFGGGAAVAAAVALLLVLPRGGGDLAQDITSAHIRALQPGHLMDVISTDQHTVKPWFDGRVDFAPPVKDLAARGFPLIGGRLDYLDGHPAAALVYRREKHLIDLYVWPVQGASTAPRTGERNGYNLVYWRQNGMQLWAVSDLEAAQLRAFVHDWRAMH